MYTFSTNFISTHLQSHSGKYQINICVCVCVFCCTNTAPAPVNIGRHFDLVMLYTTELVFRLVLYLLLLFSKYYKTTHMLLCTHKIISLARSLSPRIQYTLQHNRVVVSLTYTHLALSMHRHCVFALCRHGGFTLPYTQFG